MHTITAIRSARMPLVKVYGRERRPDRSTGIAGRGLNPYVLKCTTAQDLAIGNTVERHAAGEAQVASAGLLCQRPGHPQYNLLEHGLDRGGNVHVKGRKQLIRSSHRR